MSVDEFSGAARAYFLLRGINPDLAARLGVREHAGAIVWPTVDADGRPSPRRRSLNGNGPKVRGAAGATLGLWWPAGPARAGASVLLCEGESDALAALTALNGNDVAVASAPGTGFPRDRIVRAMSAARPSEVLIGFDGDGPGEKAAAAVSEALTDAGIATRCLPVPDGEDLASVLGGELEPGEWLAEAMRNANGASVVKSMGSTADRYKNRRVDVAALLAEPDTPIPWRCDKFAADGFITVLAGRGGEGKSWLALALAHGVATGTPRAGIACRQGLALIFDAENGRDLLRRRLRAAGVTDGVGIVLVDGLDIVKDAAYFESIIREEKANLVIFDSLRMLSSGRDEDKSGDMEKPLSTLRRMARNTRAAIVLVHHRGKGTADFRGSSVIADQTDMLYALGRETGDPEQRTRRKLHTAKCRIDEEPEARWVAILADRKLGVVSVNRAEPYEPESSRPRDTLREDVLGVLTGISQSGARIATALGRAKTDGTIRRVLDDLRADGFAEKRADGWGLPVATSLGVGNLATPGDGLDDLGQEQPLDDPFPAALKPVRCRCDGGPLCAPDADGELRCTRCGHTCDGWVPAA